MLYVVYIGFNLNINYDLLESILCVVNVELNLVNFLMMFLNVVVLKNSIFFWKL